MQVELMSRRPCGGCQDLKRRLAQAGIEYVEHDVDTADGLAAWAWHDAPALLPAVAVDGQLLDGSGDVEALFETITRE